MKVQMDKSRTAQAVEPVANVNIATYKGYTTHDFEYFGNLQNGFYLLYTHPAQAKPLSEAQYTEIAHRTASRYTHRSETQFVAYTFLPHMLEDFVRKLEAAIKETLT